MSERPCVRGCTVRDAHAPGCRGDVHSATYGGDRCNGCVPAAAADGAMLCTRCIGRLRRTLEDAPDLVAHLRSQMDPQKAQVYDREKLGGKPSSESQPPMSADLVDAADAVHQVLVYWARYFGDETDYRRWGGAVRAGAGPVRAHGAADWAAQFLLLNLERIANDSLVRLFTAAVLDVPEDPDPQSHVEWTIAKALRRWPMQERARFSRLPCPGCELRTVLVRPPRLEGQERTYRCSGCEWVPPRGEEDVWAVYFEAGVPA